MAFIGNTNTTQAFTPAVDFFSGNGSTTAFTLSRPVASVAQVQVTIDNVAQNPSSAYTVSANTITFTSAPLSGTNNIYVYYTSPITQVIAPGQGTVTSDSFGTITNFTTTGNTVLGDATTDTLTVGVTGIVKDASGNVGIGTASPTGKLNVVTNNTHNGGATFDSTGTTQVWLRDTDATTNTRNWGFQVSGGDFNILRANDDRTTGFVTPVSFAQAPANSLIIDSSGNFMVGTSSVYNSAKVSINQATAGSVAMFIYKTVAGDAGTAGLQIGKTDNNTTTSQVFIQFLVNSANNANGQINANGASQAAFGTYSDSRLKENITNLPSQLASIMALRPVEFDYIESEGGGHQIGFVAQEVKEIYPDLVGERADGMFTLSDLNKNDARLIKAIQELKAINDTQAETINALTARIEALENK